MNNALLEGLNNLLLSLIITKYTIKLLKIKSMKHLKIIMVFVSVVCFTFAEAQNSYFSKFRPAKKWSVGLQLSPTLFNGDADDSKMGLSGGAHVKYSISQSFGLKLNGDIGVLRGGRINPNFSGNSNGDEVTPQEVSEGRRTGPGSSGDTYQFTNNFSDLNLTAVYTLGNISFLRPLRKVQLFTFFGVGAIWSDVTGSFENYDNADGFDATADARAAYEDWGSQYFTAIDAAGNPIADADVAADLSNVANAESYYQGRNLTIPFGFGVKRTFGRWLDLGLEWRTHWVRSDDIDAFDFPAFQNRSYDFYTLIGLQASVKLGAKNEKDHYDWLNPIETLYADMDTMKKITNELKELIEDDDNDGVSNLFDKEADTEEGVMVYGNGSQIDSDGDGIPDHKDLERFSVINPNVKYDENGRAIDTDGDGVPNGIDKDDNTPAGVLVDVNGVEVKVGSDNACCNCDNITLPAIIFENGSSKISPASYGILYTIAEKMKQCPGLNISATGYTSSKSGEKLAWNRSNAIIDHLETSYGIERSRVSTTYETKSNVEYSTRRIDLTQTDK